MTSSPSSRPRSDRKQETRRRILDAALHLVEEGRAPDALGLREVARAAGMAAPSIYNHFKDMDELGLALVDDALLRLRAVARTARNDMAELAPEAALEVLLRQFLMVVNRFEPVLRLLMLQWFNANPEYRRTIRREMAIIQDDLAGNMRTAAQGKGLTHSDFDTESEAILSILIVFIIDALDLGREEREARLVKVQRQLLMLMRGSRLPGL